MPSLGPHRGNPHLDPPETKWSCGDQQEQQFQICPGLLRQNCQRYVYDKAWDPVNFLHFLDHQDLGQWRGVTEFGPALSWIATFLSSSASIAHLIDINAKVFGWLENESGELHEGDPIPGNSRLKCAKCKMNPCECTNLEGMQKQFIDEIEMLALRYGKEKFTRHEFSLPSGEVKDMLACLLAMAPESVHLPASFVGLKSRLQGTDIRLEMEKAAREFARVQEWMAPNWTMVVRAALLRARRFRPSLASIPVRELLRGHWSFGEPLTADKGHNNKVLLERFRAGVSSRRDIWVMLGLDPGAQERKVLSDERAMLEAACVLVEEFGDKGLTLEAAINRLSMKTQQGIAGVENDTFSREN